MDTIPCIIRCVFKYQHRSGEKVSRISSVVNAFHETGSTEPTDRPARETQNEDRKIRSDQRDKTEREKVRIELPPSWQPAKLFLREQGRSVRERESETRGRGQERKRERERGRERGVRTNRNVLLARLETAL